MAFIQDPRLRQTWNQLSQTTETVTSDAAAGIWTFGHRYVQPCLSSLADAVDSCTSICLGDREERARRARERDRGAWGSRRGVGLLSRPEYSFDFYDDWEEDLFMAEQLAEDQDDDSGLLDRGASAGGRRGILGGDWDRLLAGSGHRGRRGGGGGGIGGAGDVVDQPRRRRGMSYGTRGGMRRKVPGEEDPNVIPRTAPLGFLGRLPFKIMGSLRYKPSAANLREHPGGHGYHHYYNQGATRSDEQEPLLGSSNEEAATTTGRKGKRPRSDTTNSGDTSSSYRSRGDLFPSDGEGDEDAVPLDDEFTVALERVDDRGSTKTRSSKGKRPDERDKERDRDRDKDKGLSRTLSRTTISSIGTPNETKWDNNSVSTVQQRDYDDAAGGGGGGGISDDEGGGEDDETPQVPSLEDLRREEEQAEREEIEEIERRRRAASQLARERGLKVDDGVRVPESAAGEANRDGQEAESAGDNDAGLEEVQEVKPPPSETTPEPALPQTSKTDRKLRAESTFVPARLPHFG
ncbi:hypothetical protein VTH82DRAFT_2002 [Thermothelomyces myriococcoides]